jgi:hypothetical protein
VSCSFRRPRHQSVAKVLSALDADRLRELGCHFGGGTAIALALDEFRESADIDFLCSDRAAFRRLRESVFADDLDGLFKRPLKKLRETRADRDGIRNFLEVDGIPVKFEIIDEGRIELAASAERVCGVTTLSLLDAFAEKLLANTDRGLDRSTNSRDLIDLLALLARHGDIPGDAWLKAEEAYGTAVRRAFRQSALLLRDDRDHWRQCMSRLAIDQAWEASIAASLARVSAAF